MDTWLDGEIAGGGSVDVWVAGRVDLYIADGWMDG